MASTIQIDRLLETVVRQKASDLHLAASPQNTLIQPQSVTLACDVLAQTLLNSPFRELSFQWDLKAIVA